MSANTFSLSRRLLAALSFAAVSFTAFAPSARAVTISSTVTGPTIVFPSFLQTENNPSFATFNFASALAGGTVASLGNVNITLTMFNLDTNVGGIDFNNITLTLGGFDTGIKLNGFTNGTDTLTFNAASANTAAIINLLNTTGTLTAGILDANGTGSGANLFAFGAGSITLDFQGSTVIPAPFSPAQGLGLVLVAMGLGYRELKRRRLLTPALVGLAS